MASPFAPLLDLQDLDVRIDQHRHRRANLPERREAAELSAKIARLDTDSAPLRDQRAALGRDEKKLEDEANALRTKAAAEDKRLYSGTVTSPRELQAIQDEISSLKRRQSELEDAALAIMDEIEPLEAQLADAAAARARHEADLERVRQTITVLEAEIDAETASLDAERRTLAASIDATVVAKYESLRRSMGGVAVAKLEAGSCRGCHIKLSAVDLDRVLHQPPDAVVNCEQCGRILIR